MRGVVLRDRLRLLPSKFEKTGRSKTTPKGDFATLVSPKNEPVVRVYKTIPARITSERGQNRSDIGPGDQMVVDVGQMRIIVQAVDDIVAQVPDPRRLHDHRRCCLSARRWLLYCSASGGIQGDAQIDVDGLKMIPFYPIRDIPFVNQRIPFPGFDTRGQVKRLGIRPHL